MFYPINRNQPKSCIWFLCDYLVLLSYFTVKTVENVINALFIIILYFLFSPARQTQKKSVHFTP